MLYGCCIVVGMMVSGIVFCLLILIICEFWMSGSEYQVNIVLMLLQYKQIDVLLYVWQYVISGVLVVLCVILFGLCLFWLVVLCLLLMLVLLSWLLLCMGDLWWVLVSVMLGVMLVLLVWVVWWILVWYCQVNCDVFIGLGNCFCFEQLLQQECDVVWCSGKLLSLVLIDVDYFKCYNDCYGYQVGDCVLCDVVCLIGVYVCCLCDMVVCYGGDEFVLVLLDILVEGVCQVIEDLIVCVCVLLVLGEGSDDIVMFIIGVFICVFDGELQFYYFVEGVDIVFYQVKVNGCDGYMIDGGV